MSANNGYIGRAPGDSSVIVARQTFNPTGGQTTFTFDSTYDVGYLDAYLNGARLINASDYTAADGNSVVLGVGATTGDVLECVAYKAFNLGQTAVGVSSGGTVIKGDDVRILNFIGTGNTFALNGNTVDISISGGGGAAGKWQTNDTNSPPGISTATNVSIGVTLATSALTVTGDAKLTGVVTATTFIGNLTGNASGSSGSCSGNAATATALQSARNIGGVSFDGTGNINLPGVDQAGTQNTSGTAGGLSGTPSITVQDITAEMVSIGGTLTYEDVTNIDSVGLVTARTGIQIQAGGLTISGVTTGLSVSGVTTVGIVTGATTIGNASGNTVYYGSGAELSGISVGISTEELTGTDRQFIQLDLSKDEHKVTTTGLTTITVGGGSEGTSHVIRITNSGVSTCGFSTYFLWPSGAAPTLPTNDGAMTMVTFTVNKVGTTASGIGTQLFTTAALNFS